MTGPEQNPNDPDLDEAAGNTGALAAASDEDPGASDPLAPLNAVTEDDE